MGSLTIGISSKLYNMRPRNSTSQTPKDKTSGGIAHHSVVLAHQSCRTEVCMLECRSTYANEKSDWLTFQPAAGFAHSENPAKRIPDLLSDGLLSDEVRHPLQVHTRACISGFDHELLPCSWSQEQQARSHGFYSVHSHVPSMTSQISKRTVEVSTACLVVMKTCSVECKLKAASCALLRCL